KETSPQGQRRHRQSSGHQGDPHQSEQPREVTFSDQVQRINPLGSAAECGLFTRRSRLCPRELAAESRLESIFSLPCNQGLSRRDASIELLISGANFEHVANAQSRMLRPCLDRLFDITERMHCYSP